MEDGNGDFAEVSIGGIYLNHDDAKVIDVAAGCNGSVAGELGGAAFAPAGYQLVFNAHQAPTTLGQNSYDEDAMNQDIGFASIGSDLSSGPVVWLTDTADIDEADIGTVKEGQKATFTVAAFPNRKFNAQLVTLYNSPTTANGVVTFPGSLLVDNRSLLLRPGLTATAERRRGAPSWPGPSRAELRFRFVVIVAFVVQIDDADSLLPRGRRTGLLPDRLDVDHLGAVRALGLRFPRLGDKKPGTTRRADDLSGHGGTTGTSAGR